MFCTVMTADHEWNRKNNILIKCFIATVVTESFLVNLLHVTHEISRLEALAPLVWKYIVSDRCGPTFCDWRAAGCTTLF
jgi:hypothetical protein